MGRRRTRRSDPQDEDEPPTTRRRTRSSRYDDGRRAAATDEDVVKATKVLTEVRNEEGGIFFTEIDCKKEANGSKHHTSEYEHENLVLRRGQEFMLTITFNEQFTDEDKLTLIFTTGSRPKESKSTIRRLPLIKGEFTQPSDPEQWYGTITDINENTVTVMITSSCEAPVGKWSLYVDSRRDDIINRAKFTEEIYFVFNPWNKDDDVYMEDVDERKEYVMNEFGLLWRGSVRYFSGAPWVFGQFDDVCLDTALYLLDKAKLHGVTRACPVEITRALSSWTNSMDNKGVLEGRWTSTYPKNSTKPWEWTGSPAILEEFMQKKKPVQYGQCWVFSGLLTTLCRALGIPTRSVTNFESAHDTDLSLTWDQYLNEEDLEPNDDMNYDSVWNFHVWNEAWFKRPDLPHGYDGWQAFDATPQEESQGKMQCGPSPLTAIKEGLVYFNYDTPFIFAEVNGDRIYWVVKENDEIEYLKKDTASIGRFISTKAVGSNKRNDITHLYKYPELSAAERKSVRTALKFGKQREQIEKAYRDLPEDVEFKANIPETALLGGEFKVSASLKNKTDDIRDVKLKITARVTYYTGHDAERIISQEFTPSLKSKGEETIDVVIKEEDYIEFLKPEATVRVYMMAQVKQTTQIWVQQDDLELVKPSLKLQAPDEVTVNDPFDLVASFKNPLSSALSGGVLHISGPSIVRNKVVHIRKIIGKDEEVSETITLSARRSGHKELVVTFSADQLTDVRESKLMYVKYSF